MYARDEDGGVVLAIVPAYGEVASTSPALALLRSARRFGSDGRRVGNLSPCEDLTSAARPGTCLTAGVGLLASDRLWKEWT